MQEQEFKAYKHLRKAFKHIRKYSDVMEIPTEKAVENLRAFAEAKTSKFDKVLADFDAICVIRK